MNGNNGGKREKLRAFHRKGRALMRALDDVCHELETLGASFFAAPPMPSLTDEQFLAVTADRRRPGSRPQQSRDQ